MLPQTAVAWALQDSWAGEVHIKAFFPFLESKPAKVEKNRRYCPLPAALKKKERDSKDRHLQEHGEVSRLL